MQIEFQIYLKRTQKLIKSLSNFFVLKRKWNFESLNKALFDRIAGGYG